MNGKTTKTNTVTWLHLSDLHLCSPKTGWEADGILNALKKDFQTLNKDYGLTPDLIFFTGDAAYGHLGEEKGKAIKDQYEEAEYLFMEICELTGVPLENLFIVPGNHDVNRSIINTDMHEGFNKRLQGDYNKVEKELSTLLRDGGPRWEDFIKRLADYKQFLTELGMTHLLADPNRLIYTAKREINGITVGIAGLNSAWSSYGDSERGKLWLGGHWQIQTLSNQLNSVDVKIALMHHPFNWFNPVEDPKVKIEMGNHFDFFLHGHEHLDWVDAPMRGNISISAGACYGDTENEMGYNMVQLDVGADEGKIWLREYDNKGERWIPQVIGRRTGNDGIWSLKRVINKLKDGEDVAPDVKVPPKPGDVITPGSPESSGVYGRREEIEKISQALNDVPIVTVFGMQGIGKTMLIKEVAKKRPKKADGYFKVVVPPVINLKGLYRQLASTLGCHDDVPNADFEIIGRYDFSSLKKFVKSSEPAIIHLERAHHLFGKDNFKDSGIREFLNAIIDYYKDIEIILECNISTPDVFPKEVCRTFKVHGISCDGMTDYYRRPFKDKPEIGWELDKSGQDLVYKWLGGNDKKNKAHPMAMMLLATVAEGSGTTPVHVLKEYEARELLVKDLEEHLFRDLYENVLSAPQQHMLRLCSLYTDDIPYGHVGDLSRYVGDLEAFANLKDRCLLTPDQKQEWYDLHSIIRELTRKRFAKENADFYSNHEVIANAWLKQLKGAVLRNLPNIIATNQALHHLTEAKNYERLNVLENKFWDEGGVRVLEQISANLDKNRRYEDNRHVLELLVKLNERQPKYHRFLAQTIEKLKGRGDNEALMHYKKAFDAAPTFPHHLTDLGKCLLARKEPEVLISLVEDLDNNTYQEAMDNHNIAIYTSCLEADGQQKKASILRREQIDKGIRDAAFYADEANYLLKQGNYDQALDILEKAEKSNCADNHTIAIKALVWEKKGEPEKASALRREQIDKGIRDAAFYADEANYLLNKGDYDGALDILEKAEKQNCANEFILAVKATVLEKKGEPEKASALRREQIDKGARNPAFYTDEANYLLIKGDYDQALDILEKAQERNCADNHTIAVKAQVLEKKGEPEKASALRREQIDKGVRDAAFYADEAMYLIKQKKYREARAMIEKAETVGCADEVTRNIKAKLPPE